ncbi:hypothetical protein [Methanoculleus sp.]|uniref:hypothetical protein n=1 Tax=Methanoculleus sp. TaxID=90427 RepID=UPI0025DFE97A|nr:hypothetical protein [Methanoculleus sp.]MCK9319724.1 hypothetical protein [Methanoculleus sp.]
MTKEARILKQINEEIADFKKPIPMDESGSWMFNQLETINQAILYTNGKYIDGDIDEDDLKLYFYNITRQAVGTTAKAIDLDTKDILLKTEPGGDYIKTWFLQRDVKYWLKKQEFGKILNRISDELPQFGSVVLKYINGKAEFVNLKNFIVEQNADCLDFSNYIIEQHLYTPMEFRRIAKELDWDKDKVNKIIEEYRKGNNQYIRVFERYGEVEDDDGNWDYKKVIFADVPSNVQDVKRDIAEVFSGEILFETLVEKSPYEEFHTNKIPGRWLGVGVPEMISENQIRINEILNQQVKSSYWNTLRLWQGRDTGAARNLLKEAENGDVLDVDEFIQPVDMQDRNLSHFISEMNIIEANAQSQTFTTDIMRGERTPAGTTLGSTQLSASQAMSFFDKMRENYALQLKSFLFNFVIPGLSDKLNTEHIIKITGEDLDKLIEMSHNKIRKDRLLSYAVKNEKIPDNNALELLTSLTENEIRKNGEYQLTVDKDYYKDIEYDIDIDITGESQSATVKAQALFAYIQAISVDPTLITDPEKKKVMRMYLEQVGINMGDLTSSVPQQQPQQLGMVTRGAGGGISAPQGMEGVEGTVTL